MKVRHFLGRLDPQFGGPTYSVPIQCVGTQKVGAEMSFVTFESSVKWESPLQDAGVEVIHVPGNKNRLERYSAKSYRKYLAQCNDTIDIVHLHGIWMPSIKIVTNYCRNRRIAYVINPRGDLETGRLEYNKFKKVKKLLAWSIYAKSIANNAACLIATSQQEHDGIRYLGATCPIAIIPNGIELNAFPKNIVHNHSEKKVVLFLSRVNPIKGIEYLIDAWSQLPNQLLSDWELHIAGNSDPKEYVHSLETKITSLRLEDSVKIIGPITGEAKMRKYQDSNLFILPTLNENFGNVVAEAMMCECPVITTKNAPWECLIEDRCGWWIELSVENIKNTLVEAMSLSDEERHNLGEKGRQSIINRYSAESVAKKTYKLYEWVLGKCEKPDFVYTL